MMRQKIWLDSRKSFALGMCTRRFGCSLSKRKTLFWGAIFWASSFDVRPPQIPEIVTWRVLRESDARSFLKMLSQLRRHIFYDANSEQPSKILNSASWSVFVTSIKPLPTTNITHFISECFIKTSEYRTITCESQLTLAKLQWVSV